MLDPNMPVWISTSQVLTIKNEYKQIYQMKKNKTKNCFYYIDKGICTIQVVPDYYDHVKFPMDMKTMGERLKSNYYVNKRLFIADMKRMITNCKVSACLAALPACRKLIRRGKILISKEGLGKCTVYRSLKLKEGQL